VRPAFAITIAALALAGCAAPSATDGPIGAAAEAVGAKPVIDYPIDFARLEKVPVDAFEARLAPRDEGFLAVWLQFGPFGSAGVRAIPLAADGVALAKSPLSLGPIEDGSVDLLDAACAPGGECLVVWRPGELKGLVVSRVTDAGASKPVHVAKGFGPARVAYDAAAGAFVVAWQASALEALHFRDGAPVEPKALPIAAAGSTLDALACSPSDGCLVTFNDAGASGVASDAIISATGVTAPLAVGDTRLQAATYGDGVYFVVAPQGEGFGFVRLGLDGAPIDPAPRHLKFLEPAGLLVGVGFDGVAFTVVASGFKEPGFVSSGARVLADGTPATPAGFRLDGFGEPLAFACDGGACAAALDVDAADEVGLSTVSIADGAPGTPRAFGAQLAPQVLAAAFPIGDEVLVAWNEGRVVRTRAFASDGTAASAVVDIGEAGFVEASTVDGGAGLLVAFHADGSRSTRLVSSADIGSERRLTPPAKSLPTPARFAWIDDTALDGSLSLRRFDAEGRALDAAPIPIVGPQPDDLFAFADVARSGDLFVVVSETQKPREVWVTRIRDTGEVIDTTTLAPSSFGGIACSPTECLISEGRGFTHHATRSGEVRVARFASQAGTVAFHFTTLGHGEPGLVAWDGAHFVATFDHGDELEVARLDDDGPRIGARLLEDNFSVLLAPTTAGRALLFSESLRGSSPRLMDVANVSLVLVDGFSQGPPGPSSESVVAEGGACALGSRTGDGPPAAALLVAAAALLARARRRPPGVRDAG
jgi:hypothetical protein